MKTFRVLVAACALVGFGAVAALAQPIGRADTAVLDKKVDSFAFVVDTSGSMMMKSPSAAESKIVMAKKVVGAINDRIPALDYAAGLYTVSPAATPVQAAAWNRLPYGNAVSALPADLPIYARLTPLGKDITALQSAVGNLRNGAIILVSDGYENIGPDAVASFRAVMQATGARLHIICFADTAEGKNTIKQLAAISSDTVLVEGKDLLVNPVAVDDFVARVFYTVGTTIITDSVFFDTAKFDLKPDAIATLDTAIETILNNPRGVRTVEIEGFADLQGGVSVSNQKLSTNRGEAVRKYLESKGVPADKIYSKGNNVSFKFNNATKEGRKDNRRADLIIN